VPLTGAERSRLGGSDDQYFSKPDGSLRMKLACSRLGRDGGCMSYSDRPGACRSYKCRLLRARDAGDISEEAARSIVQEIKSAQTQARWRLSEAMGKDARSLEGVSTLEGQKQLRRLQQDGVPADRKKALDHAALCFDHLAALIRLHVKRSYLR
jgi:Fe-S-cluster containining protein